MIEQWAQRWGIPAEAVDDLRREMGAIRTDPHERSDTSEGGVQSAIRLEASEKGARLWRNNVGAGYMEDGSFIRWGLANDTAQMNKVCKSSDLIGIRPLTIKPHHVGMVVGQFVAREVKAGGWCWRGTEREQAQFAFLKLVYSLGGDASFATGRGTL